jgi:hypothetical protein
MEKRFAEHQAAKRKAARLRRKQRAKAELRAVLKMAREALGWKPLLGGTRRGAKLTPEHIKALHAGRDRYHQAQREKKFSNTTGR